MKLSNLLCNNCLSAVVNYLNEGQLQWKTTSREDNLILRRSQWKTNSIEDDFNGRQHLWKTISMKDDLNGRQPQWKIKKTTSNKVDLN